MMAANGTERRGIVYTFYSFKGGVGRSMALANVAALLAKWGHSVLVVDWDLEAPGLERFFAELRPGIREVRSQTPGILDLMEAERIGTLLNWRDCLINIEAGKLSLLTAGQNGEAYTSRLHALDFNDLFENHDLGSYIEELRNQWISEFDFVLVDSRTGFTDIGGICTVHLADVLVLLFTTTESSVAGALSVVERARKAQERLPLDRRRLLAVPVPARDESRTEYQRAAGWKRDFAQRFADLYKDWLPSGTTPLDAIEQLRIPYIPYWSFGERLPAIEESTSDPASLGHAYEILARVVAARLDWYAALQGETLAPPPTLRRDFNEQWLLGHRRKAEAQLASSGLKGFVEVCHFLPDSSISKAQGDLLVAARQAQVTAHGWPTGIAFDNGEGAPKAVIDGIVVNFLKNAGGTHFVYWALARNGDFYSFMSLLEDDAGPNGVELWSDGQIERAAETLIHCSRLYKALGVEPNAHVEISVRYGGIRGRILIPNIGYSVLQEWPKSIEDEIVIGPVVFRLADLDQRLDELVKKLCEPLFVLFEFTSVKAKVYQEVLSSFARRIGWSRTTSST
jgi:MinD-like ATPase involved in chromosome partitioning or flagellar assembly